MIRFSKYFLIYIIISTAVIIPGMYSMVRYGLQPSIDFVGGTLVELAGTGELTTKKVETSATNVGIDVSSVQKSSGGTYLVRMKPQTDESIRMFQDDLTGAVSTDVSIIRSQTVGPTLGRELLTKAIQAAVIAVCAILAYVAYAFKNIKYGISAIVALVHDVLVMLGTFSLLGHVWGIEVDTLYVTALLTTMSFSVHDTIVVFDRIREYRRRDEHTRLDIVADRALTETMNRSLINSFTIIFMLLALVLMGGQSIRWFVVALLIGTVSGTYSSPFVATPVLLLLDYLENRRKKH